jgi:hypothetical protein
MKKKKKKLDIQAATWMDGWMEGSFQEVGQTGRQTDIIEQEEEDASTFSVDLEKPRQKRRKRKERKTN